MCPRLCFLVPVLLSMAGCVVNAYSISEAELEKLLSPLVEWKPRRNEQAEIEAAELATAMQKSMRCAPWSRQEIKGFTFTICIVNGRLCLNPSEMPAPPFPCTMHFEDSCEVPFRYSIAYTGLSYKFTICEDANLRDEISGSPKMCASIPRIEPCGRRQLVGTGGDAQTQSHGGDSRHGPCYCITGMNGEKLCDPRCSY